MVSRAHISPFLALDRKPGIELISLPWNSVHTYFLSLQFVLAWLVMAYYSIKARKSVLPLLQGGNP